MNRQWKVAILLFNEAEVLDFAGPFEVFSTTTYPETKEKAFIVNIVSEKKEIISARNGFKVQPDFCFDDASSYDVLIIPGGYGAEEIEIHNERVISWIRERSKSLELAASVCTGAFLLAEAGLLDGRQATTHWMDLDRLEKEYPEVIVKRDAKFVDEGHIITSAGISAGINMSLYIVKKLLGRDIAMATARRMEYDVEI